MKWAGRQKVDGLGVRDKLDVYHTFLIDYGLRSEEIAYMGDDLPDLSAIQHVGLGCCPADAVNDVRAHADWVATNRGGDGAVRELAEQLLRSRDQWALLTEKFFT